MEEIREAEAPPETAAIFAEIRAATGLPFVNLLWRHMAALPGVLPWIWGIVGDEYRAGAVAQAAARIRDTVPDLGLATLGSDELAAAGLDEDARRTLRNLVDAYNRGNSQNLVGWTAVLRSLAGEASAAQDEVPADATLPDPLPPLPPIPRFDDLAPATRDVVARLAGRHASFTGGARPSLYVHLATWPKLVEAVDARLGPALEGDRLRQAADALRARGEEEAGRLAPRLRSAPPPPEPGRTRIVSAMTAFAGGGVPDMIVVGTALARALD